MRHAYALRKFNRVGPPSPSEHTITIDLPPSLQDEFNELNEAVARFRREMIVSLPSIDEISSSLAHAFRGLNR